MKLMRSIVRKLSCLITLIILALVGHNIATRYTEPPVEYLDIIIRYSQEYTVDKTLIQAVIQCESSYDPDAVSPVGACGLMQLTEETFYDVRKMVNDSDEITFDTHSFDPEINIKYGTKYLSYLSIIYDGDIYKVLAAYNAGMGNVNAWIDENNTLKIENIEFPETKDYVEKVLKTQQKYRDRT